MDCVVCLRVNLGTEFKGLDLCYRTAPPSQAVMAVCKSYRHVKKPVDFKLLWSTLCEVGQGRPDVRPPQEELSAENNETWSIWLPIAPPGYSAVGCVVERGTSPPLLSVVHCIRSDLLTSGSISDCIYYIPPGTR